MNKEDAKQAILGFTEFFKGITGNKDLKIPENIAKEYGIEQDLVKQIEKEPCEDAVSREAVKEQMIKYGFHAPDMTVTEFVENLPPATPQPKMGSKDVI